ncbi:MAG: hypothetical protein AAB575_02980, partial [Patescibacteria group bacterium]
MAELAKLQNDQKKTRKQSYYKSVMQVFASHGMQLQSLIFEHYDIKIRGTKLDHPMIKQLHVWIMKLGSIIRSIGSDNYIIKRDEKIYRYPVRKSQVIRFSVCAIVISLMTMPPLLFCFTFFGSSLPHYDKFVLDYLNPIINFFDRDHPFVKICVLVIVIIGYCLTFVIFLTHTIDTINALRNPAYIIKPKKYFPVISIGCIVITIISLVLVGLVDHRMSDKAEITSIKLNAITKLRDELSNKTLSLQNTFSTLITKIHTATTEVQKLCKEKKYLEFG